MVQTNSHGTNTKIRFHYFCEPVMRKLGFTDHHPEIWSFSRGLGYDISFNVHIPKNGGECWIDVLDESFGQPYDYQKILETDPNHAVAGFIFNQVEHWMSYLQEFGVLSGHEYGEYI